MYLTFELARYLYDAPFPATKSEIIDYAERTGAPQELLDNLAEIEDDGEPYVDLSELWDGFDDASLFADPEDDDE